MPTSLTLKWRRALRRHGEDSPRQDQHFLSLLLDAWSSRRPAGSFGFAVSVATGIGAGAAGIALQTAGWSLLNIGMAPILILSLIMILRWVRARRVEAAHA